MIALCVFDYADGEYVIRSDHSMKRRGGQLTSMKIDNMREEHQERVIKNAEREAIKQAEEDRKEREQEDKSKWKEYGFISVSAGAGIGEIFKGLGVDYLIDNQVIVLLRQESTGR